MNAKRRVINVIFHSLVFFSTVLLAFHSFTFVQILKKKIPFIIRKIYTFSSSFYREKGKSIWLDMCYSSFSPSYFTFFSISCAGIFHWIPAMHSSWRYVRIYYIICHHLSSTSVGRSQWLFITALIYLFLEFPVWKRFDHIHWNIIQ